MPFNVEAPMVSTFEPSRYPSPDWSRRAEVREAWLPEEGHVGWLIIQDDTALVWMSSVGSDRPASQAVRGLIEDSIRESLSNRDSARDAWNKVVRLAMFKAPEMMDLQGLVEELQKAWS